MREQIAVWIPAEGEEYRLNIAGNILFLIRSEIEKVENPYQVDIGMLLPEGRVFESCRLRILSLLK